LKRNGILLVLSLMCMALFTGCTSSADTMPQPTATGTAAPTTAPTTTVGPTVSLSPSITEGVDDMVSGLMPDAGVNSVEDASRVSERMSEEIEKLSELDSAEAVVAGSIALVGVSYDDQYQGGLTERLEKMVTERAEMIDKAITSVHVTDEKDAVMKITQLREKLKEGGLTFEELQTQVLDIGSSINGGGSAQVSQPESKTGT